jgi:hypothetical protein
MIIRISRFVHRPVAEEPIPGNAVEMHFSQSYDEARSKFLSAVRTAGLEAASYVHPSPGSDDEVLATDVVLDGASKAEKLLILCSGCHGVEGFCGSGIQTALLHDQTRRAMMRDAGVAVLYIHAINPYGFSWWRRTTHENIDLNRNFQDFTKPLPSNPGYDKLAHLLVPAQWPPTIDNKLAILKFVASHGIKATQAAVSGGQYDHPQGLFYGGRKASWSNGTLRDVLRTYARDCAQLAFIDLHTGLGPSGIGERIFSGGSGPAAFERARAWWGPRVTSTDNGSSSSAAVSGEMWNAIDEECSQAERTGIVLEYGTVPMRQVFEALRADQWLANHPEAPDAKLHSIKRQIRDAFYVDTGEWKRKVTEQAMDTVEQAVQGLRAIEKA